MKRSINLNGFQPKYRRTSAQQMADLMRALGMSDEQIRAAVLKTQAEQEQGKPPATPETK